MNLRQLSNLDKVSVVAVVFCFLFWILAKMTWFWDFDILYGFFYEMGSLPTILFTCICPFYFLVKWIMNKFTFKKIYFYGFLLSILTVLIMRFVYSISISSGIIFQ